ncbi:hypothetical protein A2125_01550 [Candidatus Woesebacteria bacterium GWB1_43_5]|uniref:Fibronectin type-III domain-containing protein n=1 Tax=Candidatus Woesebacteria bacterium GWB1_43_5 TaxID=1802474 RepID=A0A1F7WS68_9BACT|nr:MAG: hypothetical protein A2125_01550 [Candidatus Woesebacteria bacterium GWB1_43_5]
MRKIITVPTAIGMFLLIAGITTGIILIQGAKSFRLGATSAATPKDVRVSNTNDSGFSISWITDAPSRGFVKFGESQNSLNETALAATDKLSTAHSISLTNLQPSKNYFFKINSEGSDFDSNAIPWSAETAPTIGLPDSAIIISGKVQSAGGIPVSGAVVYAQIQSASALSSTTSSDGSWLITLSLARATPKLAAYAQITNQTVVDIFVQAGADGIASAKIRVGSANPTPTITLGETKDFTNLETAGENGNIPEATLELPENATASSKFAVEQATALAGTSIVTLESHDEGEVITTTTPAFFGEGPPGVTITITVESEPIIKTVKVSASGGWNYAVGSELPLGTHKITISWRDVQGILRTLTRTFIVQAAEGAAFEATPSGTLTPSPKPTPTPTPLASPFASPVPIPDSGILTPTIIMFILGIGLIVLSAFVLTVLI